MRNGPAGAGRASGYRSVYETKEYIPMKYIEKHPLIMIVIGIIGISFSAIFAKYSQAPSVVTAAFRLCRRWSFSVRDTGGSWGPQTSGP